jgi:polyphosphate glucokinase
MHILVIDVGGTHVKILVSGEKEKREIDSGPSLTARQMVSSVKKLADGWEYDVVSIGYPGPVVHDRPIAEPHNLGKGWRGFNFAAAFKLPTKVINDAAMQALGSYRGGKMLFEDTVECLVAALRPDDVVLGGGNAKRLKELPPLCRLGDNANAFKGGFRMWEGPLAEKNARSRRHTAQSAVER